MATAFSATRWVLLGSFGFRILAFAGQAAILRFVSKEVFGAYGAIISLPMMLLPLLPLSLDQLLIREKARARRYSVALAWALLVLGLALVLGGAALWGVGAAMGWWTPAQPDVDRVLDGRAMAVLVPIVLVMAAKLSVRSQLAARLDFRTISIGEFCNGLITYFAGAAAVFFVPSLWPLLVAYLAGEIFEWAWMQRGRPFRPAVVLSARGGRIARRVFRRHRKFCLANTADLVTQNVGSLIPAPLLAFLLSEAATADFSAARMLIQLPVMLLVGAIWRVAYPTLTNVDDATLHSRCLRIIGTAAAFIAPLVIWLAFFAPATAWMLGGEAYLSAAPLIRWMALYMVLTAVYSPISSLDMIRDRPEIGLYWNIVHTIVRVAIIFALAPSGLNAVIAAMAMASAALWLVWAAMLGWLLGCGWRPYTWAVAKFIPSWLLLGTAFWLCQWIARDHLLAAIALSALPGLAYLAATLRYFPNEATMFRRLLGRG